MFTNLRLESDTDQPVKSRELLSSSKTVENAIDIKTPGNANREECLVNKRNRRYRINPFLRLAKYDCQKKAELLSHIEEPLVIVEVGSYLGEELKQFAELGLNRLKKIYTFEPTPAKLGRIRKAIAKKGPEFEKIVELNNSAVSDQHGGTIKLHTECAHWKKKSDVGCISSQQDTVGGPPPWRSKEFFEKYAIDVPVVSLDQSIPEHIHLLKMDTQGHEYHILKGAHRILSTSPPDVIHMEFSPKLLAKNNNFKKSGKDLLDLIYSYGYICFDCDAFSPPEIRPGSHNIDSYHTRFGSFQYDGGRDNDGGGSGDHGQWTDLVCII